MLITRNGPEYLRARGGFVLGGMEVMPYKQNSRQMMPGDSIFLYTDGVPEATAGSKELFGTGRLTASLNACKGCGPEEILRKVKSDVDDFVGDAEQFDDLTMMCFEYKGNSEGDASGQT